MYTIRKKQDFSPFKLVKDVYNKKETIDYSPFKLEKDVYNKKETRLQSL